MSETINLGFSRPIFVTLTAPDGKRVWVNAFWITTICQAEDPTSGFTEIYTLDGTGEPIFVTEKIDKILVSIEAAVRREAMKY